jgi:hypothetical protein
LGDIICDEMGWLLEGLECEVVDNPATTAVSSTKNTKENRKVLVASFTQESVFKLPNNLDLEDKSVVKEYYVKWDELVISYTSLENWEKYTSQPEDEDDIQQEVLQRILPSPQWIQRIRSVWDRESKELTTPDKTEIQNTEDYVVEYEQDA